MANRLVVGAQWGDEGKGKVVDLLARTADWVARFSGGANAGHTVKIGSRCYALHLVPTGILVPRARCLIGNGVVLDLPRFFEEIDLLSDGGVDFEGRLFVSLAAHLVLPHHKLLEVQSEDSAAAAGKIGTTMRGIGPAYADKIARRGVRAGDLCDSSRLRQRVRQAMEYWDRIGDGFLARNHCSAESVIAELERFRPRLEPMLVDASRILQSAASDGQAILFEGAQGALLDVDFGTYPYVTSSNTTAGGVCTGLGVPPGFVNEVIGVVKAYTTRVGNGPFPTEAAGEPGDLLRERGQEFGTTTGRGRRCGWLDLVALKYAVRLNGITHIAVTKLDVLDGLREIPVSVKYALDGEEHSLPPMDMARLEEVTPVYRTMPGWLQSTVGITDYDDLPSAARDYLRFLTDALNVKLTMVSTGPERDQTIFCDNTRQTASV